ncbi:PrgI family protein [Patescibacteria group bacterium]
MQHQTPQFIEVEDKIFGPFTFRQFLYLAGGAGISFIIYILIPIKFFAFLFIAPVIVLSLALAFYKINNRPFIQVMESAFSYWVGDKLYIWKKEQKKARTQEVEKEVDTSGLIVPKLSDSKLKDISWSLDVHKKIQ